MRNVAKSTRNGACLPTSYTTNVRIEAGRNGMRKTESEFWGGSGQNGVTPKSKVIEKSA